MVYPALIPLMRTPRLPLIDCTEAPADLNGLIRFAERRNLVSERVPSHFKRSLPFGNMMPSNAKLKTLIIETNANISHMISIACGTWALSYRLGWGVKGEFECVWEQGQICLDHKPP